MAENRKLSPGAVVSGKFFVLPIERLFDWVVREYESCGSIFGIHKEIFFKPSKEDAFRIWRYGRLLETPLGAAAGPHTQLAQNIISAWLVGARYIELKTVQTLDEIEVSKPCIHMEDEGYNCEWSQELRLEESFDQYLNAFILIHYLREKLGFRENKNGEPGFIFNMSVGYDMKGILNKNVQAFLNKMENCAAQKEEKIAKLEKIDPAFKGLVIPDRISDNVTLSTMHGCPAGEIEEIARYLMQERGHFTTIKLNPTLLGKEAVRDILNKKLGYDIEVPDEAFAHDLKYDDALKIIENLSGINIKLTNTLETLNRREIFSDKEKRIYMSGRALHPVSINLAARLQKDLNGQLDISFCAGMDCFNIAQVLNCGLMPVTVCSDLLKPGGYTRLAQYLEQINKGGFFEKSPPLPPQKTFIKRTFAPTTQRAGSCQNALPRKSFCPTFFKKLAAGGDSIKKENLKNLKQYAAEVLKDPRYYKSFMKGQSIKTGRELMPFDCIHTPCAATCPTHQDVPQYMRHTAAGDFDKALEVILKTNPFPAVTGMVCDHPCMSKCTRINYDNPLQIREIKNFIRSNHKKEPKVTPAAKNGQQAAVIGAGPAGLSCAYFLTLAGFSVEVYEAEAFPGGMAARAIPSFRLRPKDIARDIRRIEQTGVNIFYNTRVDQKFFNELKKEKDFIFIGVGAGISSRLNIPGEDSENVSDALSFLAAVRRGEKMSPAEKTAVIGGGNSAVDAARTALRLTGETGEVTIIYRRSRAEMPACAEEIEAAREEGVQLLELTAPVRIEEDTCLKLTCTKMKLGEKDRSGRRRPLPVENSLFELQFDRIICAVGQQVDLDFLDSAASAELAKNRQFTPARKLKRAATSAAKKQAGESIKPGSGELPKQAVFLGGDALHGPKNLITAIADGRKAAEHIIQNLPSASRRRFLKTAQKRETQCVYPNFPPYFAENSPAKLLLSQRVAAPQPRSAADELLQLRQAAKREYGIEPREQPPQKRKHFKIYRDNFSKKEAMKEAGRCLSCDQMCGVCVSVCPNRANISYRVEPVEFRLQQAARQGEKIVIQDGEIFKVEQQNQVLHIVDFCNACGNCRTFCPTAGAPYLDKPRFCLSEESFADEEGIYFFCREDNIATEHTESTEAGAISSSLGEVCIMRNDREKGKRLIKWKPVQTTVQSPGEKELNKNKIETLFLDGDEFVYRANGIFAKLDKDSFAIKEIEFLSPEVKAAGFRHAAQMSMLLRYFPSYLRAIE